MFAVAVRDERIGAGNRPWRRRYMIRLLMPRPRRAAVRPGAVGGIACSLRSARSVVTGAPA